MCRTASARTTASRAPTFSPSTRAKPGRPAPTRTVRARPRRSGSVVCSVRDSSSSALGWRSATPCEESVRQRSTRSPPAPTSSSWADQTFPIVRLNVPCSGAFPPPDANICSHMDKATILHADVDAFFAAVEQRDDPRLRGRPVLVGAWVVLAASYEAKARGVDTPMGVARALRLCPNAVVVEPRMSAYVEASKAVFEVFEDTSPLVEGLSIDEAFLDVRGVRRLSGSPAEVAARLRAEVRERVGLPITVGVARTKFLAKVASRVAKPDGLLIVPPGREFAFLHPLPVERLWGVGRVTAGKLHRLGIRTVGEVAALAEPTLVSLLGRASGRQLHALAHNRDPRPVLARR